MVRQLRPPVRCLMRYLLTAALLPVPSCSASSPAQHAGYQARGSKPAPARRSAARRWSSPLASLTKACGALPPQAIKPGAVKPDAPTHTTLPCSRLKPPECAPSAPRNSARMRQNSALMPTGALREQASRRRRRHCGSSARRRATRALCAPRSTQPDVPRTLSYCTPERISPVGTLRQLDGAPQCSVRSPLAEPYAMQNPVVAEHLNQATPAAAAAPPGCTRPAAARLTAAVPLQVVSSSAALCMSPGLTNETVSIVRGALYRTSQAKDVRRLHRLPPLSTPSCEEKRRDEAATAAVLFCSGGGFGCAGESEPEAAPGRGRGCHPRACVLFPERTARQRSHSAAGAVFKRPTYLYRPGSGCTR